MIKELIAKVVREEDLTEDEMAAAMDEIMTGAATPAQIGAFITALRLKGETVDEITGAARTMRAKATKININNHAVNIDRDEINIEDETILDIVGTGGDGTRTFNVSTTTAFVAAGGGIKVAKHGNRAVSSLCGSADVLESLNVNLDLTSTDVENCISEIGIGFLYAPLFHGAMKYAAGPRKEIGIRSIFNLLGPVTNPAGASAQVLGVYEAGLTDKIALVLQRLGTREAFVVCGEGTYDEISICGPTKVSHLKGGEVHTFKMTPEEYGLKRADCEDIVGGDAAENANITRSILNGDQGPKRDMVLLNASAAFVAAGVCENINDGIRVAADAIDSGKARQKLDQLIEFTRQCKPYIRKVL
ncbi:Anthranilate phosphoribosyltransferase (EC [Olavius algarvensis Delta 1 endosymbiont]|nr:Anthranilate phosphoribosyltransferase (EC [Olavius algarvensis Delta 1 endosymbiont]